MCSQQTQNICITVVQRRPNVFDVGPTLYKWYTKCFVCARFRPGLKGTRSGSNIAYSGEYQYPGTGGSMSTVVNIVCGFANVGTVYSFDRVLILYIRYNNLISDTYNTYNRYQSYIFTNTTILHTTYCIDLFAT